MEAPPNSLSSSLSSSTSIIPKSSVGGSNSTSSVSSVRSSQLRILKVAENLNDFVSMTNTAKPIDPQYLESIVPPLVFRRHLSLAKAEDKSQEKLYGDLENRVPPSLDKSHSSQLSAEKVQDKGSKTNFMSMKNISSFVLPAKRPEDLDPSRRISLDVVISNPNIVYSGKYLLCLNGTLPTLSHAEDIYILSTVVEDSYSSSKAVQLEIFCDIKRAEAYFHSLKHPYLYNMEPGSVICLQDPAFMESVTAIEGAEAKCFCLRAKSALDVEFLPWQSFQVLMKQNEEEYPRSINDFVRAAAENSKGDSEGSPSVWQSLDIESKSTAEEWRQWGNEYSVRRLHTLAFFAYSAAIRFDPDSIDLAASRSASLISLGFYKAALNDVEFITSRDPFNTGYILRKTNCFWGLGKYEEALEYLRELLTKLIQGVSGNLKDIREDDRGGYELRRKSMFIQRIIVKTEDMIERRDTHHLLGSEKYFRSTSKLFYDEPEYYNPVRVVYEDINDPHSRKLVISRREVKAGSLLVVTKALSVVFLNEVNKFLVDASDELMNTTIQKIMLDKPTKSSIYKFSCSEELLAGRDCDESGGCQEFSKEDIKDLCESYFYSCNTPQESNSAKSSQTTAIGIWPFLKNIKHACVGGNSVWYTCGNFLFVRAIRDIESGEEIIMAHIEATEPHSKRTKFLEQRGMICQCPLCLFEKSEPEVVQIKRLGLLNEVRFIDTLTSSDWSKEFTANKLKKINYCIEDLIVLRGAYARLNFPIVEPLMNYGLHMMATERFDDAITAFERAFNVVDNTAAIFAQVVLSLHLSYCYLAKKKNRDKSRSKKWFSAMKNFAMLLYGCLDPVKFHFRSEFEYLESKGVAGLK